MIESLVATFGYAAILVGTFLEGETILIVGGFAAHRGWLDIWWVIACAFAGSFGGDELYFFVGRARGAAFLHRKPRWAPRIRQALAIFERHRDLIILGCRFLYGVRIVVPFAIGMTRTSPLRFLWLNFLGAAIWAVLFGWLGYLVGEGLETVLDDLHRYELGVLVVICLLGLILWCWRTARRRRRMAAPPGLPPREDTNSGASGEEDEAGAAPRPRDS